MTFSEGDQSTPQCYKCSKLTAFSKNCSLVWWQPKVLHFLQNHSLWAMCWSDVTCTFIFVMAVAMETFSKLYTDFFFPFLFFKNWIISSSRVLIFSWSDCPHPPPHPLSCVKPFQQDLKACDISRIHVSCGISSWERPQDRALTDRGMARHSGLCGRAELRNQTCSICF